mmetsp:Transcript_4990/g.15894  ORF Transcript_4990/g.15894 Transcript_4990/m.15894 type:complete len:803 (+) Transcript_4990:124-2532(+)
MASASTMAVGPPGGEEAEENIKVCVRFRPVNSRERRASTARRASAAPPETGNLSDAAGPGPDPGARLPWRWDRHAVQPLFPITRGERSRQRTLERYGETVAAAGGVTLESPEFLFDRVFGIDESTEALYDEIMQDLVVSAMEGKHSSAFAFGQTSTGKTYTMQGTSEFPGVIPRAVHDVFAYISRTSDREFLLRVSYMEVYNESINDLFEPLSTNLKVFEDPRRGPQIQGLEEKIVVTPEQVFALLSAGEAQRHIGSTDYNKQSSRSHTIFRLVIESRAKQEAESAGGSDAQPSDAKLAKCPARVATLNLVDLAGSESAQSSQSHARRQEGSHINKSLLTLTHVIYKLSERAAASGKRGTSAVPMHIPYRDSKLTRILQKSLQGNSRISIVCTATPWAGATEETLNTLRFATRAKKVRRAVHVNEVLDERALLLKYKQEIAMLRERLAEAEQQSSANRDMEKLAMSPNSAAASDQARRLEDTKVRVQIDEAIRNLNRVILNSGLDFFRSRSGDRTARRHRDGDSADGGEGHGSGQDDADRPARVGEAHSEDSDAPSDAEELLSLPGSPPTTPKRGRRANSEDGLDISTPFFRKLSSIDQDLDKWDRSAGLNRAQRTQSHSTIASLGPKLQPISLEKRSNSIAGSTLAGAAPPLPSTLALGSPAVVATSTNVATKNQKRDSIASELRTIREQLASLLRGTAEAGHDTAAVVADDDTAGLSRLYVEGLESRVKELEGQLARQDLEHSVGKADRSFLEQLLAEKDEKIREWGEVIHDIEERQERLEAENAQLRAEVARLREASNK